jgi:cell division protein FtsL
MPSWSAAAVAYTEAAPVERRRRPRQAASRRPDPLRSGVLWIIVVGTLLAGLVAVNVAVLQLNVRLDRLSRERAMLREQNAALASQFSSSKASPRIQARARNRLGLEPASEMTYVELPKR